MPRGFIAALVAAAVAVLGTACGGADEDRDTITVWTQENLPDRMAVQRELADAFTRSTGVRVLLVGVAEDQFSRVVRSAAAAGRLPDVIGALPLASVRELEANDLLDTETPGRVVERLGRDTFLRRALELGSADGRLLAVPSDAWVQLILYREDLFARAGLDPPDSYARLRAAASRLHRGGTAGVALAVGPSDTFTAQTFEYVALANGCELVGRDGRVTIGDARCEHAFAFYAELARRYSVPGTQSLNSVRATYFSGKAAIAIWSSFILDELAGLRSDALPSCAECRDDPGWLARHTGVVTALRGPDAAHAARYGEIVSWAITREADRDKAERFVTYMMEAGYERWLGMAPEGKIPVRTGTRDDPRRFAEAWDRLPAGVDRTRPLDEVYPRALLDRLRASVEHIERWGVEQGQGRLVGAIMGELPVPRALSALVEGSLTPRQAAAQAQRDVEAVKRGIRE
ncbi:bicyclomycin resistance protein [Thermopolyspora flexuosa]|uniref:Carbohydrate ABC transporter substrate-binding protein (CUT1 family) n=1 Tax=Thermopolyspora flexuosa TaxID=103836 RepID=A0A543IZ71_9ACTN|nr:ABC transporter substrate-binding protein [Thermopolyspora flexuosa]TQM75874.1 carbohydrate ABC transporter substrate-binding protein (CUT1 family) [Thermopolyspora flexuosa]GGM62828.1 bicyclomycin resistance protein [Thermopolyspora flexuosa]